MKHLSTFVSVFLAVLTLSLVGLLLQEKQKGTQLATQLTEVQGRADEMEFANSGLEKAIVDLHEQINTLRNAPPMVTLREEIQIPVPEQVEALEPVEVAASAPQTGTPLKQRELTAEERAAKEAQERRRQEFLVKHEKIREGYRQRLGTEVRRRKEFFAQIPLEGLAPEYMESNQQLLASFDEMEAVIEQIRNPEVSLEDRHVLTRKMWRIARGTSDMMEMQRDVLLNDYAQQNLGLNNEQTQGFLEYLETINTMTSARAMIHGASPSRP